MLQLIRLSSNVLPRETSRGARMRYPTLLLCVILVACSDHGHDVPIPKASTRQAPGPTATPVRQAPAASTSNPVSECVARKAEAFSREVDEEQYGEPVTVPQELLDEWKSDCQGTPP
jgi:hypothetical protein